jgi:hypothetical protein
MQVSVNRQLISKAIVKTTINSQAAELATFVMMKTQVLAIFGDP